MCMHTTYLVLYTINVVVDQDIGAHKLVPRDVTSRLHHEGKALQ